jgi:hypothetical protein
MKSKERLLDRIKTIVYNEKRPVSFKDLLCFDSNGKIVSYKHGSLRNLISQLLKEGQIIVLYKSPLAFYSLPGITFGNKMTQTCISVTPILTHKQRIFLNFLKIHKLEYPSIHDIRLTFEYKGLRRIIQNPYSDLIDTIDQNYNKDITLRDITLDDITLKITIHNTDKITVMVACSNSPIFIDYLGIAKLSSALTRVEERLQSVVDLYYKESPDRSINDDVGKRIPFHMNWIVTMWHFGYDSKVRFAGEQFETNWKEGIEVFRIYLKKSSVMKIH